MALERSAAALLAAPSGAQAAQPAEWSVPEPEDGTVAPRTQEELRLLFAEANIPSVPDRSSATALDGPPVGAVTWLGVRHTLWQWVARGNAFSILQVLALATDDLVPRSLAELRAADIVESRGWMDAILNEPWFATPVPNDPAAWQAVDAIQNVRLLPDGRVAADLVVASPSGAGTPMTDVLVHGRDRWLDDEVRTDQAALSTR